MRIYLPILALILAICLRFSPLDSLDWCDGYPVAMQPPLPQAVLSAIYHNAGAADDADVTDARPTTAPAPATAPTSLNHRQPIDDQPLSAQPRQAP